MLDLAVQKIRIPLLSLALLLALLLCQTLNPSPVTGEETVFLMPAGDGQTLGVWLRAEF